MEKTKSLDSLLGEYRKLKEEIEKEKEKSENRVGMINEMYILVKERSDKLKEAFDTFHKEGFDTGVTIDVKDVDTIEDEIKEINAFEKGMLLLRLKKYYNNLSDDDFGDYGRVKYDTVFKNMLVYLSKSDGITSPKDEDEIQSKLGFSYLANIAYFKIISNIIKQHYEFEKERGIDLELLYGNPKEKIGSLEKKLKELEDAVDVGELLESLSEFKNYVDKNVDSTIENARKFGEKFEEDYRYGEPIQNSNTFRDKQNDQYETAMENWLNTSFLSEKIRYKNGEIVRKSLYGIDPKYFGMAIYLIKKGVPEQTIREKILDGMMQFRKEQFETAYAFAVDHKDEFEIKEE